MAAGDFFYGKADIAEGPADIFTAVSRYRNIFLPGAKMNVPQAAVLKLIIRAEDAFDDVNRRISRHVHIPGDIFLF